MGRMVEQRKILMEILADGEARVSGAVFDILEINTAASGYYVKDTVE